MGHFGHTFTSLNPRMQIAITTALLGYATMDFLKLNIHLAKSPLLKINGKSIAVCRQITHEQRRQLPRGSVVTTSASFLAEISVSSPLKLFIFIIY